MEWRLGRHVRLSMRVAATLGPIKPINANQREHSQHSRESRSKGCAACWANLNDSTLNDSTLIQRWMILLRFNFEWFNFDSTLNDSTLNDSTLIVVIMCLVVVGKRQVAHIRRVCSECINLSPFWKPITSTSTIERHREHKATYQSPPISRAHLHCAAAEDRHIAAAPKVATDQSRRVATDRRASGIPSTSAAPRRGPKSTGAIPADKCKATAPTVGRHAAWPAKQRGIVELETTTAQSGKAPAKILWSNGTNSNRFSSFRLVVAVVVVAVVVFSVVAKLVFSILF